MLVLIDVLQSTCRCAETPERINRHFQKTAYVTLWQAFTADERINVEYESSCTIDVPGGLAMIHCCGCLVDSPCRCFDSGPSSN